MVEDKKSLANLLRNHINEKVKAKFDYSTATNRKQDILNFIESNKQNLDKHQLEIKTIRPSHNKILDDCLKNAGIDPSSLGRSVRKPKYIGSDLQSTITPEPQSGSPDQTPKKPTVTTSTSPTGEIIVQQQIIFDEKGVSATLNAIFLMFRLAYPELELLSEDEKDSLGKMWLPAFNKYLTDNWAIIGVPIFGTMGIFLPKLITARKLKKIRQSKSEGNLRQKEIDEKNEEQRKRNEAQPKAVPKVGVFSTEIEKDDNEKRD